MQRLLYYTQQPPANARVNFANPITKDLIAASARPDIAAWLRGAGWSIATFPTAPAFRTFSTLGSVVDFSAAGTEVTKYDNLPTHNVPLTIMVEFTATDVATAGQQSIVAYGGRNATTDGWTVWKSLTNLGLTFGGVANYQPSGITLVANVPYVAVWRITGNGGTVQVHLRRKDTGAVVVSSAAAVGTMVAGTGPLTIGAAWNATSYDNAFPGYIGTFAVWNRCLSSAEAYDLLYAPYQLWAPAIVRNTTTAASVDPLYSLNGFTSYTVLGASKMRGYDMDGATPFVNPSTGESDLKLCDFNGTELAYFDFTSAGAAPTPWLGKVTDTAIAETVNRVELLATDAQSLGGGFRTSLLGFEMQRYQIYDYELEFKLDAGWNFSMSPGDGALWQVKSSGPKVGQDGHPVMSFNLTGHNLQFVLLYPQTALDALTWPTSLTWSAGGYATTSFTDKVIDSNVYHNLRVRFYADDRPPQFGGRGYCKVYYNGQLWVDYSGPTIHPDQSAEHRCDFSWYQWSGQPTADRIVYFRKAHLYYIAQPSTQAQTGSG